MALTISSTDLSAIRRRTGDSSAPYDLADTDIDAIYTSASEGNLSLDRTTFFVLRERLGIATNAVAISGTSGGITRNQKFDQIWRLFKYWGEITGLDIDDFSGSGFAEWSLNSV